MWIAALLVFLAQDPPPSSDAPAKPKVEAAAEIPEYDAAAARRAIKAFGEVKAKAPLAERSAALDELLRGTHERLVPVLRRVVLTESSLLLRKKALAAIGLQPAKSAGPVLMSLLADKKLTEVPELAAAMVTALSHTGYPDAAWPKMEALFRQGYEDALIPMQQAVLQLAQQHGEHQAIELLLDNLDEPVPKDPEARDNPPAAYWEARWKAWRAWRDDVRSALQTITGQRFGTSDEARDWLRANARRAGIRWKPK